MQFYHFTAGQYLSGIAKYGLTVGDVPTDLKHHKGVCGVWLTSSDTSEGHGLNGGALDKQRYRLTVDIEDTAPTLVKWTDWAAEHLSPGTITTLINGAGPKAQSDSWYIFFGEIEPSAIVSVVDMQSGIALKDWHGGIPGCEQLPGIAFERRQQWHKHLLKKVKKTQSTRLRLNIDERFQR